MRKYLIYVVRKEERGMSFEKMITIRNQDNKKGENGFKIIEVNVSYPAGSIFTICTPIKKQ
jgi:hypothetical protein